MKNFKEKLKKLKNPFLIVLTIFMFLLSLLTAYSCGYDKGKESVNNKIEERFVKRSNDSDYIYTSNFISLKLGGIPSLSTINYTFGNYSFSLPEEYYKYFYFLESTYNNSTNKYDYVAYRFDEYSSFSLDNLFIRDLYTTYNSLCYTDSSLNGNCLVYFNILQYLLDFNLAFCNTPLTVTFDSITNSGTSNRTLYSHKIGYGSSSNITNPNYQLFLSISLYNSTSNVTSYILNTGSTLHDVVFNFSYGSSYTMKTDKGSIVDVSQLENYYQMGYESGYNVGLEEGTENGYKEGFTEGVNNAVNPLIGFDNTFINMLYQGDTDWIVEDSNIELPINGYTYDFNSYVSSLKGTRDDEGNGNDNGVAYIDLNGFTPFMDNQLELNLVGFYKVEYIYNDLSLGTYNISNYRDYSTFTIQNNKLVESIKLYFYATDNVQNGYILNLYTTNTYQDGYQNGFNQGLSQGNQEGYREGFTEGREEGKTEGYNQGYDIGYNSGYNVGNADTCKLNTLVFSIADIPVYILSKLLGFELFGFNLFVAFCSVVTIILIIFLVKKFSK